MRILFVSFCVYVFSWPIATSVVVFDVYYHKRLCDEWILVCVKYLYAHGLYELHPYNYILWLTRDHVNTFWWYLYIILIMFQLSTNVAYQWSNRTPQVSWDVDISDGIKRSRTSITGLILVLHPANVRRRYFITSLESNPNKAYQGVIPVGRTKQASWYVLQTNVSYLIPVELVSICKSNTIARLYLYSSTYTTVWLYRAVIYPTQ